MITAPTGGRLDCCGEDSGKENCEIPIILRSNDPYFSQFNRLCLHFARSQASPDLKCNFGKQIFSPQHVKHRQIIWDKRQQHSN